MPSLRLAGKVVDACRGALPSVGEGVLAACTAIEVHGDIFALRAKVVGLRIQPKRKRVEEGQPACPGGEPVLGPLGRAPGGGEPYA